MKPRILFLVGIVLIFGAFIACAQTNEQVTVTNSVPVITHLQVDPEQLKSQFNSFAALMTVAGAWLMREIMTIGSSGGVVGLWGYFWRGIKPKTDDSEIAIYPRLESASTNIVPMARPVSPLTPVNPAKDSNQINS
jgi:hypothetical protein